MKMCAGKPLIQWTIEEAVACKLIDHVLVSTDDPQVAELVRSWTYRHNVDILTRYRDPYLSQDATPMMPVLKDALVYAEDIYRKRFGIVVLLQPTSPVRQYGITELCMNVFDCVVLPTSTSFVASSHDRQEPDGQCYVFGRKTIVSDKNKRYFHPCFSVDETVDIDTQEDFDRAEAILHSRSRNQPLRQPESGARHDRCGCGFGCGCSEVPGVPH